MREWKKITESLETVWAPGTNPLKTPFDEYPRPQMVRGEWKNLNGLWDYCITEKEADIPSLWAGQILVPFAVESAASGVRQPLLPDERLWYRRLFSLPESWSGQRILLHFEAVDWECRCRVNGKEAGSHRGGYLPFSFDISEYLVEGDNEIILDVWDPTDSHWQQRGKQMLKPRGCFYTATSGIWQTVWLEALPADNAIREMRLTPRTESSALELMVETMLPGELRIRALDRGEIIADCSGPAGQTLSLSLDSPRLWSPDDPHLYDLEIELLAPGGEEVTDSVKSYFAMRKISRGTGRKGDPLILLNDKALFLHGPLDQGYWPESGMTPPSEQAILFDLEKTKALGFNMTRKHIKVEPRRWYYHADRLGLMVIQDMVSSNCDSLLTDIYSVFGQKKDTTRLHHRVVGRSDPESRRDFEEELSGMMDHLHNHPSIVIWCPFNESWGQFDASRIGRAVKEKDPGRLVDEASGWYDQWSGDFLSRHTYVRKLKKPGRKDERIFFYSEYGGYNLLIPGHLWNEKDKFAYRTYKDRESLEGAYTSLIREQLIPLVHKGLGAAVYTQISDVEIESNGFYTYDRKICKFDEQLIAALNREIYKSFAEREGL